MEVTPNAVSTRDEACKVIALFRLNGRIVHARKMILVLMGVHNGIQPRTLATSVS